MRALNDMQRIIRNRLILELEKNPRKAIPKIAKELKIPNSTVYDNFNSLLKVYVFTGDFRRRKDGT